MNDGKYPPEEKPRPGDVVHYQTASYRVGRGGNLIRMADDERNQLLILSKTLGVTPRLTE